MKKIILFLLIGILVLSFLNLVSASSEFVTVNGTEFYLNGKQFYFAGANSYYLWYKPWSQVEEVLNDAKAMNLTIIRTWGFCNGQWKEGYCFQPSPRVYDENTFQRMDKIIKEAGDRKIKLMIPLINNWDDFGGICQYIRWCNETIPDFNLCSPFAGPGSIGAEVHDAFYTNNCTKELYKNYVAYFLNRNNKLTGVKYKDDPAIFAWQLANEPRARSDTSGQTLYDWISEMSAFVKSIDNNHLLTTGEDGFYLNKSLEYGYNGYDGQDFVKHHQIPTIDFASMNMYPWTSYFTYENLLNWIKEHAFDAQTIIKKPVTLNEFGVKGSLRDEWMRGYYNQIEDVNLNGDLFWLLCDDSYPDYDGYCIYYPSSSTVPITINHSNIMKNKNITNHFPKIEPIENIRVNETQIIRIIVNASDEDRDNLSYYISDSRYNKTGNVFEWQTKEGDKGIYFTTIYVNDGSRFNVSTSFYAIVRGNNSCFVPYDNMIIDKNISLCTDIYYLPHGLKAYTDYTNIDCNKAILIGNNSKDGIYVTGIYFTFDYGSIRNCEVKNYVTGIFSNQAKFNVIENNNMDYNINYNLYVDYYSNNNLIINNSISHTNNYVGLQLYNSNNNTIIYNNISYHDKGVYNTGLGNIFRYNNIENNGMNFFNYNTGNVTAEYNWWGTASLEGIRSKIYDCRGDPYYGCVDFIPYLCKRCPTNKISPCLEGDVDGNCKVDIFDLAAVGLCYGKDATGTCEIADLSGNGKIDIFDLATVGLNYGKSC